MRHRFYNAIIALSALAALALGSRAQPILTLERDDTVIDRSCTLRIPPGLIIPDANNNGVVHITTPGVIVRFERGSILRGAPDDATPDTLTGHAIRVDTADDVQLENLDIRGFKLGVIGDKCDSLVIHQAAFSHMYRQRLRSTPQAEDSSDWLFPHHNDHDEWATQHGGAIFIKNARDLSLSRVTVRESQNGIILSRVHESDVFDNDCSFLSGWGLALWRSTGNVISRNALDFCVRGHSEGVYNRGQDSAGLLMFEQCSRNTIIENSITHGGDGIFGFAGLEAVNGEGAAPTYDFTRKGCNDNLFISNDLSYAPAHGLEMTFSFGNKIVDNRFVQNAICGVWGGYSQETLILDNRFEGNGGMAYGLERGGINIEHGSANTIARNQFTNNRCGVHLWWDPHGEFAEKAWGKANYKGVAFNAILDNTFTIDDHQPFGELRPDQKLIGVQLRTDPGANHPLQGLFVDTSYVQNNVTVAHASAIEIDAAPTIKLQRDAEVPTIQTPRAKAIGDSKPVGARAALAGRANIIMGEWGPWDHASVLMRQRSKSGAEHVYEVFGAKDVRAEDAANQDVSVSIRNVAASPNGPARHEITVAAKPGVRAYRVPVLIDGTSHEVSGLLIGASWDARFFSWENKPDPREQLDAWRALSQGAGATSITLDALRLDYGGRGPAQMPWAGANAANLPGREHFGMIAKATLPLPKGRWRFNVLSDDGVRLRVNGATVIENWTWHAPMRDEGVIDLPQDQACKIEVEHFEIDGHAVLTLEIEPAPALPQAPQ